LFNDVADPIAADGVRLDDSKSSLQCLHKFVVVATPF
jgi:hypothetical protein